MSTSFNSNLSTLVAAFRHAATTLPFYKDLLAKKGISSEMINTDEDFFARVPIMSKEEIFPAYPVSSLCQGGEVGSFVSAIVSSGTSGVFSYGLLTDQDVVAQKAMIDGMFRTLLAADTCPPIVINALPMGVSFVSSYPVIPTSVRSDIVLHVIKTFSNKENQIVLITDPNVLKKIVEEGVATGISWPDIRITSVIGGAGFSDSLAQYLLRQLNGEMNVSGLLQNNILGTMGLTEIGLNIFCSTPDLVSLRHLVQYDATMMQKLFGASATIDCPELMYCMSNGVHVEIHNPDADGIGDIVLTHLDTSLKTMLIRYDTGDRGKIIDATLFPEESQHMLVFPLPIVAVFGRKGDAQRDAVSPSEVKELLFRDVSIASSITGHFMITKEHGANDVFVQLKPGIQSLPQLSLGDLSVTWVPYHEYEFDMELNYEKKWKHTR